MVRETGCECRQLIGVEAADREMKANEGRVEIGEPLVSSACEGGDGVHTMIVSQDSGG